ncbi:IclR family transcriptional regulator [Bordetella genomosp. 13]|uniref:IclR family transcriptional regulator n=1 Tax=Bordetella genomosp. 13 TaxID=463040 RepID=UPI0021B5B77D|nr:IclR family transcriptional regulator [Bordetella genomosp. 13]
MATVLSSEAGVPGTQSLHRAVALLRIVAANNRQGCRLVELCRRTNLERPTVHRLLQGMVSEKLVRQAAENKRYFLGSLAYELGLAAAPKVALRDICLPYLEAMAEHTGDTVFMTIRSGFDGVCVARADGSFPIKMFVHDVGRHRPLNVGASGLALMSALADDDIDRICRVNVERTRRKNPRYTEAQLRAGIESTRRRGYSTTKVMDEPPVLSVGIAIRLPDGSPAAGISVSTLSSRLADSRLEMVVRCLGDTAQAIEMELRTYVDREQMPSAMPALGTR